MLFRKSEQRNTGIAIFIILFIYNMVSAGTNAQSINNPRSPAEWEEAQGILIGWNEITARSALQRTQYFESIEMCRKIINAAIDEGLDVYIVDDTVTVFDQLIEHKDYKVADTLKKYGLTSEKIHIVETDADYGIWMRDTGPFNVYENETGKLHFVCYKNDGNGIALANKTATPLVALQDDLGEYSDGGNWLTDGHNRILIDPKANKSGDNPYLSAIFGISDIIEFKPYQVHVDYYIKMVSEETIFVSEVPSSNYDPIFDDIRDDSVKLEQIVNELNTKLSCYGRPYKIIRIKNARTFYDRSTNIKYPSSWGSYTNSLIINKTVLVPTYMDEETNQNALELYRQYMPGYNIIPIPSSQYASRGGATHCLTHEIAADNPILIFHAWLSDTVKGIDNYQIDAVVKAADGISSVNLYWSVNPSAGYNIKSMNSAGGENYQTSIPVQNEGAHVYYYIEAESTTGKKTKKPLVAPNWTYNFTANPGGKVAVEDNPQDDMNPGNYALAQNYPNPFNPITTINYSISKEAHVSLKIYDILGREIKTLVSEYKQSGTYSVKWDGTDYAGRDEPAGVYLYKIEAGSFTKTKKMMFLK